jgi:hypothetical protein
MTALDSAQLADLRGDLGITSAIQTVTLTGNPTGGTFTLTYQDATTTTIAYNAAASVVQAALVALSTIGAGGATVAGNAGGPWTVTINREGATLLTGSGAGLTGGSSPAVSAAINVVFTDAELQRFWTRSGEDYDKTVVTGLRQILAQSAKFFSYTVGQTSYQKQQIREGLEKLLDRWEKTAGMEGGSLSSGTLSLGLDEPEPTA